MRSQTILILCVLVSFSTPARGEMTPALYLKKCFEKFTGLHFSRNHRARTELDRSPSMGYAIQLCQRIIESVRLGNDGILITSDVDLLSIAEQKAILETMNSVHRSWFSSDEIQRSVPDGYCMSNDDFMENEAPLFVTRSLFGSDSYDHLVTANNSFESVRVPRSGEIASDVQSPLRRASNEAFKTWTLAGLLDPTNCDNPLSWEAARTRDTSCYRKIFSTTPLFNQVGDLMGVRRIDEAHPRWNARVLPDRAVYAVPGQRSSVPLSDLDAQGEVALYQPIIKKHSYGQSAGAGVLGLQGFLLASLGRPYNEHSNGRQRLPRRLTNAIYNDLLCRPNPTLRATDIASHVSTYAQSGEERAGFEKPAFWSASCQTCHASMDGMAGVFRNMRIHRISSNNNCLETDPMFNAAVVQITKNNWTALTRYPDSTGSVESTYQPYPPWNRVDVDFDIRPPTGVLHYRAVVPPNGASDTLINTRVSNVVELGRAIAESDDLYICAASRYVSYLSGQSAMLIDETSPDITVLSAEQAQLRRDVVELGKEFKRHRNPRRLIQSIVAHPIFVGK